MPAPAEEAGEPGDDVAEAAGLGERRGLGGELEQIAQAGVRSTVPGGITAFLWTTMIPSRIE